MVGEQSTTVYIQKINQLNRLKKLKKNCTPQFMFSEAPQIE